MPDPVYPELAGKAAVITGASRGIGAAAAHELARHGVCVVLAARSASEVQAQAAQIRAAGGRAEAMVCDVSRHADVEAAIARCREAFGRLDILVNNAGVIEPIARLADADPDAWDRAIDINVKGVYHGLRAAIPVLLEGGGGVIVNLSSGAASAPREGWSHYCASKAAVLALTRCADAEYGAQGVRVVGLSPGTVATDMQVAIRASGINPVSRLDPAVHAPSAWVGHAIAWLCTAAAADLAGTDFALKSEAGRRRVGLPV